MICQICGKEIKSNCHIVKKHHISAKDYYDTYIRQSNEGFCPVCGKETSFIGISQGYHTYCSKRCAGIINSRKPEVQQKVKQTKLERYGDENYHNMEKTKQTNKERYGSEYTVSSKSIKKKIIDKNQELYGVDYPLQSKNIQEKTKQSLKDNYGIINPGLSKEIQKRNKQTRIENKQKILEENDLIPTPDLVSKYGLGWFHKRNELNIEIIKVGIYSYINSSDEQKIIEYNKHNYDGHKSFFEYDLLEYIRSIYNGEIVTNRRSIIKPYELDAYLPDLQLAFEFNGKWYHSVENDTPINYHLMKSLLCREKGIRLVHIYDFEDLNIQKQLLKNLISGVDNYPKNDFNKNNLLKTIPEPTIIYQDCKITVYGAGGLK